MMRMIKPSLDRIFNGDPPRDEVEEYLSAFIGHAERTRISAVQAREDVSKVYFSCVKLANLTVETQYCYSGLRTILNDLEIARSKFAFSLERIDKEIVAVKNYASDISVKTSFTLLPDEMFGIVFEFAGHQDLKSVVNICGVCRRFRGITLSIPRLWRFISLRGYRIEDAFSLSQNVQSVRRPGFRST
ncbi:hypothetical protein SCHPADRAFT_947238 [Schizopora paradoxa]|uniref:F-box domain-containing protein n=1 Tax=Schizopora paradoxa TaxID=27342 RepID=A0A0H2QZU4_9AGAM|nr:hypothetical protein SCHPADRAFT_947238 [Schizopora paradoxa]